MNPNNPIAKLFTSSKALVMIAVVVLAFAALLTHNASWDQIVSLIKFVVGAWMGASGLEEAAKHTGAKPADVELAVQKAVSATMRPPPPSPEGDA